ncbi:MAG: hypothetical protein JWR69_3758 [Pedosphaera sp.]|nr:hypothetical protein [Pedosphaera sp.]
MAAKVKEYQRLPGRGSRRQGAISVTTSRSRLWLGKDHLLCIDSAYYSENYKRFYFRDIRAFVLRKTITGMVVNIVLGVMWALALGVVLAVGEYVFIISGILSAFFGGIMLLNTLTGPTCVCQVKTAVQTEELPSLNRIKRARKVLARLRPLIAQAQEELAPDQTTAPMAEMVPEPTAVDASNAAPPIIGQGAGIAPPTGV